MSPPMTPRFCCRRTRRLLPYHRRSPLPSIRRHERPDPVPQPPTTPPSSDSRNPALTLSQCCHQLFLSNATSTTSTTLVTVTYCPSLSSPLSYSRTVSQKLQPLAILPLGSISTPPPSPNTLSQLNLHFFFECNVHRFGHQLLYPNTVNFPRGLCPETNYLQRESDRESEKENDAHDRLCKSTFFQRVGKFLH